MVLIILMMIVGSLVIVIALVASMVVAKLLAAMLLVAQYTAARGGKMSSFIFFWLLFILGNLLKNANHFVGCLTLLEESNDLEWVSGHHLVQIHKLELMCLGLHEEALFTLLLRCGHFHCSTEVAILKIAEELYLTPHKLVHWH